MPEDELISELRELFPVTKSWIYLYNGGINACPKPVGDAMRKFIDKWESGGRDAWPDAFNDFTELRHAFGNLIGANGEQIAITESTTASINIAAHIINPEPHQNVVLTDLEFMSDTYPWIISHPVEVRFVPSKNGRIIEKDFESFIDSKTAAVSVSAVAVGSGYRIDLEAVTSAASKYHTPIIIDGAQAVGMIPLDIKKLEIDFLVCTASKWLFGPTGIGFLYIGDRFLDANPPCVGWLAAENRNDWDLRNPRLFSDAMRFQAGIPNLIGAVGALAGIRMIEQVGLNFIQNRVRKLTRYLLDALGELGVDIWTPRQDDEHAGIVFFYYPDAKALYQKLKENKIYTGCFLGGIRLDVHFFNTLDELEQTIRIIKNDLKYL